MEYAADGCLEVRATGDGAHDALRHYTAGTVSDRWTVIGNGAQVADVTTRLAGGAVPAVALDDLEYEPDPPIYTPRITAIVDRAGGRIWLGTARRGGARRAGTDVVVVAVSPIEAGQAVMLSTYESDGIEITSAPAYVDVDTTAVDAVGLLDDVWEALDPAYRIAAVGFDPMAGVTGEIRHA